jgi:hypothetical protein
MNPLLAVTLMNRVLYCTGGTCEASDESVTGNDPDESLLVVPLINLVLAVTLMNLVMAVTLMNTVPPVTLGDPY